MPLDASPWLGDGRGGVAPPARPAVPGDVAKAPRPSKWAEMTDRAACVIRPIDMIDAYNHAAEATSAASSPREESWAQVGSVWEVYRKRALSQRATADSSRREDPQGEAAAARDRAHKHFSHGEFKQAIEAYGTAVCLDPSNAAAYAGRGGAMLRGGDAEGALADLNAALEMDPRSMYALRDRAEARQRTGDLRGALSDYNAKLTLAPADGRACCGRGNTKQLMGDTAGAIADYGVAVRLNYPGAQALLDAAKRK